MNGFYHRLFPLSSSTFLWYEQGLLKNSYDSPPRVCLGERPAFKNLAAEQRSSPQSSLQCSQVAAEIAARAADLQENPPPAKAACYTKGRHDLARQNHGCGDETVR